MIIRSPVTVNRGAPSKIELVEMIGGVGTRAALQKSAERMALAFGGTGERVAVFAAAGPGTCRGTWRARRG
jgi:hypothetical protein